MTITVNLAQAKEIIATSIRAGIVPMLSGSPASGKSSIIHALADEYNLALIDMRLAQYESVDLSGFPSIDKERGRASYMPMSTFPLKGDKLPEGKDGWLLFLDEMNSADRSTQKASYKLILDRMIGENHLHEKCVVVAAGNLDTDNAIVEEMSTALQSRMLHLQVDVDLNTWLEWANENGMDHRITSFLKFRPNLLYNFKPDHTDKTYASPRTWEFANRILSFMDVTNPLAMHTLAGTVSEGVAREFLAFTRIYKDLPTMDKILADGENLTIPSDPGTLYALTGSIAAHCTETTCNALMKFVTRFPKEFQVVCLRDIVQRDRSAISYPAIGDWIRYNGKELF